jgi:hypothetical protein
MVQLVDLGMPISKGGRFGKPRRSMACGAAPPSIADCKPDAVFSGPDFANLITALALYLALSDALFFPSFHAAAAMPSRDLGSKVAGVTGSPWSRRAPPNSSPCRPASARTWCARRGPRAHRRDPQPAAAHPLHGADAAYPWQADLDAMGAGPRHRHGRAPDPGQGPVDPACAPSRASSRTARPGW